MKNRINNFQGWLVLVVGATLAVEMVWLEYERRQAGHQALQFRKLLQQRKELSGLAPALTLENEHAMTTDIVRLRNEVAALRTELFAETGDLAGEASPIGRIDAYFDLAALVARLRHAADEANVSVKPDEHFGFGAYANEGPPAASMAWVRQQGRAGEAILGCLFLAQPHALLAVKRELVEPGQAKGDRHARDQFVLDHDRSLRRPGETESVVFRVEFSGETPVLRRFLSALAHASEMLVVRGIDVAPLAVGSSDRGGSRGSLPGAVARRSPSHFAVTVEAVRLLPAETQEIP